MEGLRALTAASYIWPPMTAITLAYGIKKHWRRRVHQIKRKTIIQFSSPHNRCFSLLDRRGAVIKNKPAHILGAAVINSVLVAIETSMFTCPSLCLALKSVEKESKQDRQRGRLKNNRLCLPTAVNMFSTYICGREVDHIALTVK